MRRLECVQNVLRLRLTRAGDIGSDDGPKKGRKLEELEYFSREGCRLVRAHGHLHAEMRQRRERRFDIGEHARLRTANLIVATLECIGRRSGDIAVERALQQPLESFTDE